jgi:hypothetical protein
MAPRHISPNSLWLNCSIWTRSAKYRLTAKLIQALHFSTWTSSVVQFGKRATETKDVDGFPIPLLILWPRHKKRLGHLRPNSKSSMRNPLSSPGSQLAKSDSLSPPLIVPTAAGRSNAQIHSCHTLPNSWERALQFSKTLGKLFLIDWWPRQLTTRDSFSSKNTTSASSMPSQHHCPCSGK